VRGVFGGCPFAAFMPLSKDSLSCHIDKPIVAPDTSSRNTNTFTSPGCDRRNSAKLFIRSRSSRSLPGKGSALAICRKTTLINLPFDVWLLGSTYHLPYLSDFQRLSSTPFRNMFVLLPILVNCPTRYESNERVYRNLRLG